MELTTSHSPSPCAVPAAPPRLRAAPGVPAGRRLCWPRRGAPARRAAPAERPRDPSPTVPPMSEVTRVLSAIEQGDPSAAADLLPLVYDELRRLAAQKLAHETP